MNECQLTSLPLPHHFSFEETRSFLDRGFDDCLYQLSDNAVTKLLDFPDGKGLLCVSQIGDRLQIKLRKASISPVDLKFAQNYVTEWFDLKRKLEPFYELLGQHAQLSGLAHKFQGSRLVGIPDLFEAICWAIIGQQINLTFAYQVKRALVEKYGDLEIVDGQPYYTFPLPETLINASRETLVKLKFSRQKIDYLYNVSHAFVHQEMSRARLAACPHKAAQIELLTSIKGIGIWTANYVLMKTMRDMTCITYGDAGLNKALHKIFALPKKPKKDEVAQVFKGFEQWESYLNFYLWRTLE